MRSIPHSERTGVAIQIGPHTVHAGGGSFMQPGDVNGYDVVVPLAGRLPDGAELTDDQERFELELEDFGGVPKDWEQILREQVIPLLEQGKSLLAFCAWGQGRTGTFLASLMAILEPNVDDPVLELRERYTMEAVETQTQARAVFAIKGIKELPEVHQRLRK